MCSNSLTKAPWRHTQPTNLCALRFLLCCANTTHPPNTTQRPSSANDVPIVDPPERVAGYFKLNRTHDAHMFYFYFESRCECV